MVSSAQLPDVLLHSVCPAEIARSEGPYRVQLHLVRSHKVMGSEHQMADG